VAIIFARYPAGTYAAGFAVYLGLLLVLNWRPRMVAAFFAAILIAAAFIVLQLSNTQSQFGSGYFARVGKTDNVSTRVVLWTATEDAIKAHPVFGSAFTGEATVPVIAGNLPPRVAPHNDYLEILLLGGGFSLALFVMKIISTGQMIGRTLASAKGTIERRDLLEVVSVGIAAFLVVFIFNPVLLKVGLAALFFALIGLVPSLCTFVQTGDREDTATHREALA
jgi:O-antigen ligase